MAHERAEWLLIQYAPPGSAPTPFGVVMYVHDSDALHYRFSEEYSFMRDEDQVVLSDTQATLETIVREIGPRKMFSWVATSLSNTITVEGPIEVFTTDPTLTIDDLYRVHVEGERLRGH